MKKLALILTLVFSSISSFAGELSFAEQTSCLCSLQQSCSTTSGDYWFFQKRDSMGIDRLYLVRPWPYPRIDEVQAPAPSVEGHGRQIKLLEFSSNGHPKTLVLQFDVDSQLRHYSALDVGFEELVEQIENWYEARRLEDVLWKNGISSEARRGFGVWLIRQSDKYGLLPAEGLIEGDGTLNEVIARYEDDSLYPNVSAAHVLESKYPVLFSGCNSRDGLCRHSLDGEVTLVTPDKVEAKAAWEDYFVGQASKALKGQGIAEYCGRQRHLDSSHRISNY